VSNLTSRVMTPRTPFYAHFFVEQRLAGAAVAQLRGAVYAQFLWAMHTRRNQ
jgi:hypothetical protein